MKLSANPDIKVNKFFCGELCHIATQYEGAKHLLSKDIGEIKANVKIDLMNFVADPVALSKRIIDLLYIAAYVFCADRAVFRGDRESIENKSWGRSFELHIPVFDYDFWNASKVKELLNGALTFMTGDRRYDFIFQKATGEPFENENIQMGLFGNGMLNLSEDENTDIMLFSGGLDSLAGAIERLNEHPERRLCFVSHKSNTVTTHTQKQLTDYLNNKYQANIVSYGFACHNTNANKSVEETQRTRMFLFSAIAFALSTCHDKKEFYVYENGMTSINLPKQGDVFNARASRTTHPKTMGLLRAFYKLFDYNSDFDILTPYYDKTINYVVSLFEKYEEKNVIKSAVSCSAGRNKTDEPHCGICSQCIDRRFAVYSAGLDEYDAEYASDFVRHIPNDESKNRIYNTLRMAAAETAKTGTELFDQYPEEMMDIMEYWTGDNPEDKLAEIYRLFCQYGDSVLKAAEAMRHKNDDLRLAYNNDSLLSILAQRSYLNSVAHSRIQEIDSILRSSIPLTFNKNKPVDENDFNDKVQGILNNHGSFMREYPALKFGLTTYKADHSENGIIIESKFIRQNTPPSKASEGIAADITKIPDDAVGILFAVYDPYCEIKNIDEFADAFQSKRTDCYVKVYR